MSYHRTATGHCPDESEEQEDTLDPTEVSDAFVAEIERLHCPIDHDELAATLEVLAESSGEQVSVEYAVIVWQAVSYLSRCRGGRLPSRFRT